MTVLPRALLSRSSFLPPGTFTASDPPVTMSAPTNLINTLPLILFTLLLDLPSSLSLALPYPPSTTSNLPVVPPVLLVDPQARIHDTVPGPDTNIASVESALPADFGPLTDSEGLKLEITAKVESYYLPLTAVLSLIQQLAATIYDRPGDDFSTPANSVNGDLEIVLEPTPGAPREVPKLLMAQFLLGLYSTFEHNRVAYPSKLRIVQEDGGAEFVRGNLTQGGVWQGAPTTPSAFN